MSLELSLYQLESQLSELIEMREQAVAARDELGVTGEGLDDAMHAVAVIDDQIREYITTEIRKVDGIRAFWRHCELMSAAAKEEAEVQAARSKAWRNRLDRLKENVQLVMESMPFPPGKPRKMEGRTGALLLKGNGGRPQVEIYDASLIPQEMVNVTITVTLADWDAIGVFPDPKLPRVPSLAKIAEQLSKKCEHCEGMGTRGDADLLKQCPECVGTGKQSVPGARFAPIGQHVEYK